MSALARRGYLGVQPSQAPDGVSVAALAPWGPAERAGLAVGDRVTAIGGVAVRDVAGFRERLAPLREGDEVALTVAREGRERLVAVPIEARPVERYDGLAVRLGEARRGMVRLRTIAVSPEGEGPRPCVLYAQGYACASVERPEGAPARDALRDLVAALARAGYCVWRVEKRGVGDSEGAPCADASFDDEHDDLAAGLDAMLDDPRTGDAFVLGHSLGALHAPALAARDRRVRAVALYGAGMHTWVEYLAANARRQCALANTPPIETERRVRAVQRFSHEVLLEGREVGEAFAAHPELDAYRAYLGVDARGRVHERSAEYWRGVQRAEVARPLVECGAPVLAMWGGADWLTSRDEHEALARAAGGRFVEVEGADHGFFAHPTPEASYAAGWGGRFNPAVASALVQWLGALRR